MNAVKQILFILAIFLNVQLIMIINKKLISLVIVKLKEIVETLAPLIK